MLDLNALNRALCVNYTIENMNANIKKGTCKISKNGNELRDANQLLFLYPRPSKELPYR